MDNTIKTKSEILTSSDEEKQEVGQSQDGTPQVPEQQDLLEASSPALPAPHADSSIALHQPALSRQF
jgi:hypothetical protein